MTWIPVTEEMPDPHVRVGIYDAMHVGLSTGVYDGDEFDVEDDDAGSVFVTHWTKDVPPPKGPGTEEVHRVCKEAF